MNVVVKTPQPLRQRLSPDEWRRMAAMFGLILFLHVAGALLMLRGGLFRAREYVFVKT